MGVIYEAENGTNLKYMLPTPGVYAFVAYLCSLDESMAQY